MWCDLGFLGVGGFWCYFLFGLLLLWFAFWLFFFNGTAVTGQDAVALTGL